MIRQWAILRFSLNDENSRRRLIAVCPINQQAPMNCCLVKGLVLLILVLFVFCTCRSMVQQSGLVNYLEIQMHGTYDFCVCQDPSRD